MAQALPTLFLSYDGLTDPLGQSQILPYLAGLSRWGYQVHIISFEKKERWEALGPAIETLCRENKLQWHPLLYHKSPPVLSTLYDLWRMRQKATSLHRQYHFQLVHARSYPPALVALGLKHQHQIPYLFDIRGFWPEERVEGKIWDLKNPLLRQVYNFFKRKEIALYQEAAGVITLTHKAKEILQARQELPHLPSITVIPCCADMAHFDPKKIPAASVKEIRESLKLAQQDYVLCYVGSLGTWYMLDEMLLFFKALKRSNAQAKFVFLTKDAPAVVLKAAAAQNILPEDLRILSATYAEVPAYLAAADASVFFIRPSFSKQASSPTKQGELLAMGKPIVTNAGVGDSDDILRKTAGGVVIEAFSDAALQQAARQLLEFKLDVLKTRALTREIYGLEEGVQTYQKVYRMILASALPMANR